MSLVSLVSGGLDSTLMAVLIREEKLEQLPIFIDYGQLSRKREWEACKTVFRDLGLPPPERMDLSGFGRLVPSGLTDRSFRINEDAFLAGRNALFLLAGAAYGYRFGAGAVAIGLLSERNRIFPDQTLRFCRKTGLLLTLALGREVSILAPLMNLDKKDVLEMARLKGVSNTYSCHAGTARPCGKCVSCREVMSATGGH